MNHDTYLRIALLMRYLLSAAGVFIALWAMFTALRDARRAAALKRREYRLGAVATLYVRSTAGKGRQLQLPLRRSGSVGSGRTCDARIKGMGICETLFDYDIEGMRMTVYPRQPGEIRLKGGEYAGERMTLGSGQTIYTEKAAMFFKPLAPLPGFLSPAYRRVYTRKDKQ